jgi:hypothetical protein
MNYEDSQINYFNKMGYTILERTNKTLISDTSDNNKSILSE